MYYDSQAPILYFLIVNEGERFHQYLRRLSSTYGDWNLFLLDNVVFALSRVVFS